MKKTNIKTTTYESGDFLIDVITTDTDYKAYIQHKDYCVKSLMFGMPKEQQSLATFLTYVENNLDEYIETYLEEYGEA